jgi:predicted kinase
MMPTAFLIYGHIGVGKTTVARALEKQHAAVRFTSDEWIAALYGSEEGAVSNFAEALNRVEAVMEPLWTRWLQAGVDVVLDLGFWSRDKRDHAREAVVSSGGTAELVWVSCDREVAWQRMEQRNSQLDGSSVQVSRATFDALREEVEELATDEPHRDVITGETSA